MNDITLLPCPFCGSQSVHIEEPYRVDAAIINKLGKFRKRAGIRHHVECHNCGASGAHSFSFDYLDDLKLTEAHIQGSVRAAAMAWNARHPINERAFALVGAIIEKVTLEISQ